MKVLITCPPMLRQMDDFIHHFEERGVEVALPDVVQTLSVSELKEMVPLYDGWIIGDDPANREVLECGVRGRLRSAIKWGAGVDNVDFQAAADLGLPVRNTPGMFGNEVADVALAYVIGLARELYWIDREVRSGRWSKPAGVSLAGKKAALVGLGHVGRQVARRLLVCGMEVVAYDPFFEGEAEVEIRSWPDDMEDADFLVLTCALTDANRHMVDADVLSHCKPGLRVVNVARGPLIDEEALCSALGSGQVYSAALDVFEIEPLGEESPLRSFERCILGTHNGSNTVDAVRRTSELAITMLFEQLETAS